MSQLFDKDNLPDLPKFNGIASDGLLSIKEIVRDSQTQKCDSSLLAQLREQILFEVELTVLEN